MKRKDSRIKDILSIVALFMILLVIIFLIILFPTKTNGSQVGEAEFYLKINNQKRLYGIYSAIAKWKEKWLTVPVSYDHSQEIWYGEYGVAHGEPERGI